MKIKKRHGRIVEFVRKNERASVEQLASLLKISRETIRRDLTALSNAGQIHKVHGGATLPRVFGEGPMQKRLSENAEAKVRIARAAVGLFAQGETLFVDTGSTTLYFAEALPATSALTIITNSAGIARTASRPGTTNTVFLLGGQFRPGNRQTIGTIATSQIRSFRAHHAVLTIGAMDTRTGVMDYNIEEAQIARAMISQSRALTVLADASKFNQLASFKVCPLEKISRLICNAPPPDNLNKALKAAGTQIILAT